jgi:hypothetical protein
MSVFDCFVEGGLNCTLLLRIVRVDGKLLKIGILAHNVLCLGKEKLR